MIGKISIGKSFVGIANYVLQEGKEAEIIDSHLLKEQTPNEIAKEFLNVAKIKPSISNNVVHTSISFAKNDDVNDQLMRQVARDYLKEMGLTNKHQLLVVKHQDTDHKHFHIIANRIGIDGNVMDDKFCKNKTMRICQKLEVSYNLTIAKEQGANQKSDKRILVSDVKLNIRREINDYFRDKEVSFDGLSKHLQSRAISVKKNESKSTGRVSGISFSCVGIHVKASALGKDYSYNKVLNRISSHNEQIQQQKEVKREGVGFESLKNENLSTYRIVKNTISSTFKGVLDTITDSKKEVESPKKTPNKVPLKVEYIEKKQNIPPKEQFFKAIEKMERSVLKELTDIGYKPTQKDIDFIRKKEGDMFVTLVTHHLGIKDQNDPLKKIEKSSKKQQNTIQQKSKNVSSKTNKGMSF
jgi:hypothetical protein